MVQYDISLPQEEMYNLVEEMRERCSSAALCTVGYGHLGDGNLHLNVVGSSHSAQLLSLIEPYIFERTGTFINTLRFHLLHTKFYCS